jgi:hypothetical protein
MNAHEEADIVFGEGEAPPEKTEKEKPPFIISRATGEVFCKWCKHRRGRNIEDAKKASPCTHKFNPVTLYDVFFGGLVHPRYQADTALNIWLQILRWQREDHRTFFILDNSWEIKMFLTYEEVEAVLKANRHAEFKDGVWQGYSIYKVRLSPFFDILDNPVVRVEVIQRVQSSISLDPSTRKRASYTAKHPEFYI